MIFAPSEAQSLAYEFLKDRREALLFMGCGLGKTATVLHVFRELLYDGATTGMLVVAPLRVCNLTWPAEVDKWEGLEGLTVANLRTKEGWQHLLDGTAHIYLCNYDMLPRLQEAYLSRINRKGVRPPFDLVCWDETTRAKNHKSIRINKVRLYFRKYCDRHWGMTGTPAPNGLLDLFAQARLVDGGKALGPEFSLFREAHFEAQDWNEYDWQPKANARERIYSRLGPLCLTLRSSDYLDIPDVVEEDYEIKLDDKVRAQYTTLEEDLLLLMNEKDAIIINNAAVLVGKLLQVTSGASYVVDYEAVLLDGVSEEKAKRWVHLHDGKMAALDKILKSLGKRPALLAYSYKHELERLLKRYPQAVAFNTAKSPEEQVALVRKWNAGKIPLLLSHPKSMAHGLNLQDGGSDVIWYTLPWSREDYDQLNSRLARRGQDEVTRVHRLITKNTTDEVVAEALRLRDAEQSALLEALKTWRRSKLQK